MSPNSPAPLSAKQKRLLRESFASVREYETAVIVLFYGRLFEIASETRVLFKIDIREQAEKLMITLQMAVDALGPRTGAGSGIRPRNPRRLGPIAFHHRSRNVGSRLGCDDANRGAALALDYRRFHRPENG